MDPPDDSPGPGRGYTLGIAKERKVTTNVNDNTALAVSDLVKRYGQNTVVDEISFAVPRGEVFGLLGPNGAGKTTTVECIEGLRHADGGEIKVLGLRQGHEGERIKPLIGVQLQSTGLYPRLNVRELIALFATFFPRSLPVEELIDTVGLREKACTPSRGLSGGQRQRLSLALALVNDPEVVFLDEPTTGLDPQARRGLWDVVRDLRRRGKTVLLTTHYMEEAEELCDRVAIVDKGRIIAEGSPLALIREHFQETAIEFALTAQSPLERLRGLPGVARLLTEDGRVTLYSGDAPQTVAGLLALAQGSERLRDLTIRRATLEDVFLKLTGRRIRS